ncbi:hypothetical protein Csa_023802, partial [Cucumis sativus]
MPIYAGSKILIYENEDDQSKVCNTRQETVESTQPTFNSNRLQLSLNKEDKNKEKENQIYRVQPMKSKFTVQGGLNPLLITSQWQ